MTSEGRRRSCRPTEEAVAGEEARGQKFAPVGADEQRARRNAGMGTGPGMRKPPYGRAVPRGAGTVLVVRGRAGDLDSFPGLVLTALGAACTGRSPSSGPTAPVFVSSGWIGDGEPPWSSDPTAHPPRSSVERGPGDRSKMDRDTASYCCMSAPSGRGRRVAHTEAGTTTSSGACALLALTRHVQSLFPASAAEIVFSFFYCAERERSSKRI
jgi:hypothetical protein